MRNSAGKWFMGWVAAAMLGADARGQDAQVFKFDFAQNHPLVYSVEISDKTINDRSGVVQGRTQSSINRTTVLTRYKFRLTPQKKNKDGTWQVRYTPYDFTYSFDAYGPNGQAVTSLQDGLQVKGTQNGIVVVDTTREIGMAQANTFKQSLLPKLLSGSMDFESSGRVARWDGDLPFIDYWTNQMKLQIGFFGIVFSGQAIAPGATWDETLTLKNLQGLKLGEGGLVETNAFKRPLGPSSDDAATATIESSMAWHGRDLPANFDQMGQNTALNISEFNHNRSGKCQFDFVHGRLLGGTNFVTGHAQMEMLVQGNTMNLTVDSETSTTLKLLPDEQ
jgi:hypothetical protein